MIEMEYDGKQVKWHGRGTFRASSGLPGSQNSSQQCVPDSGPIPEGQYKVYLSDHGQAKDDGRGLCSIKPSWGIQSIPRGAAAGQCDTFWANWGRNRARMEPADTATKIKCAPITRGGFYLHDSTKGYSHGCIEIETQVFPLLRKYHTDTSKSTLLMRVKYANNTSTYGGT